MDDVYSITIPEFDGGALSDVTEAKPMAWSVRAMTGGMCIALESLVIGRSMT